jgi:rubrerythrin
MERISRAALLGAGSAIALVGVDLMTRFVQAASVADADDIAALNAAIELERAGIKAYQVAAATKLLSAPVLAVCGRFVADHVAHRDALIAAVRAGGGVPSEGTAHLNYPTLDSQVAILHFARGVEEKAASTYLSVVPEFSNRALAQAAASILGVETTHVALLAQALGETSYPSSFVS